MELLCIQSQEHPKLPQCELKAVIECEEMEATLNVITEGLVIVSGISEENIDKYYQILTRRLGYTHEVHQILKTSNVSDFDEDILNTVEEEYVLETSQITKEEIENSIIMVNKNNTNKK